MRIRTQLMASAAVAAVVTLLVIAGLVHVTRLARADLEQVAQSQQVARDVANVLAMTNEFSIYGSARAAEQWHAQHRRLQDSVAAAVRAQAPAPHSLLALQGKVGELPPLFDKLAQIGAQPDSPLAHRRRELLMERLLIETQEVAENRYAWASALADQQRRDQ